MTNSPLNLEQAVSIVAPLVIDIVKALRERHGVEPSLEQVQAELATVENRARLEAEAFYLHHPEQRPKA